MFFDLQYFFLLFGWFHNEYHHLNSFSFCPTFNRLFCIITISSSSSFFFSIQSPIFRFSVLSYLPHFVCIWFFSIPLLYLWFLSFAYAISICSGSSNTSAAGKVSFVWYNLHLCPSNDIFFTSYFSILPFPWHLERKASFSTIILLIIVGIFS